MKLVFLLVLICLISVESLASETSTCLTVYEEGGAPAVFQSPKCPRWKLPNYSSDRRNQSPSPAASCQVALHQGRRKYQEDRAICSQDFRFPFQGPKGVKGVRVGIVGIFDGHNGAEASEMASKLFLDYFTAHTFFLLDNPFSVLLRKLTQWLPNEKLSDVFQNLKVDEELGQLQLKFGEFKLSLSSVFDESFPLEIFKEAAIRAIEDIDLTFSREALTGNFRSGSTATVVLMAENKILVAYVGDSKAFLCSEDYKSPTEARDASMRMYRQTKVDGIFQRFKNYREFESSIASDGLSFLTAKELTKDHHPDRDDERTRVVSAGGNVTEWGGVARVNGQLAVSRAIGDVNLKSYGVISKPEITGWKPLTSNDSYLIASSDGIFEALTSQDVCDMLSKLRAGIAVRPELNSSCSHSLADCIVNAAYEKGSTDNLSVILLPFKHRSKLSSLPSSSQREIVHTEL